MLLYEFRLAHISQKPLRANPAVLVFGYEKSELVREIDVGLIILTESYFVNQLLLGINDLPRLTSAED
jgi:hypothetical protein